MVVGDCESGTFVILSGLLVSHSASEAEPRWSDSSLSSMNIEGRIKKLRKDIFTQRNALRITKNKDLYKAINKKLEELKTEMAKLIQDQHTD